MKKNIQYDSFQSFNLKKAFFALIRSLFDLVFLFFFQMGGTEIEKIVDQILKLVERNKKKSEI